MQTFQRRLTLGPLERTNTPLPAHKICRWCWLSVEPQTWMTCSPMHAPPGEAGRCCRAQEQPSYGQMRSAGVSLLHRSHTPLLTCPSVPALVPRSTPYMDGYAHLGMLKAASAMLLVLFHSCGMVFHTPCCSAVAVSSACHCCHFGLLRMPWSQLLTSAHLLLFGPLSPAGALVCQAQAGHAARPVRRARRLRPAARGTQPGGR